MKSVAFAAMKGGVGKTTLAVHLAVAALRAGERVAIIDTDPQASAAAWARIRGGGSPDVVPVPAQRLTEALAAAEEDYSVVIVDSAPRASAASIRSMAKLSNASRPPMSTSSRTMSMR